MSFFYFVFSVRIFSNCFSTQDKAHQNQLVVLVKMYVPGPHTAPADSQAPPPDALGQKPQFVAPMAPQFTPLSTFMKWAPYLLVTRGAGISVFFVAVCIPGVDPSREQV